MRKISILLVATTIIICLFPTMAFAAKNIDSTAAKTTLAAQASAADESEPNNSFDEATSMSIGSTMYATIDAESESDVFVVDVKQPGTVKLTLTNGKYSNYGGYWLRLYNHYYQEIYSGSFGEGWTTKPSSRNFSFSKGRYYIEVYSGGVSLDDGHPYSLKTAYVIPGTTISKLTPAKKSFTAKWTKKAGAYNYQLRYSVSKNMSNAKTINISKKYNKKAIKKLKAKKKYWVQLRVAKKIDGVVYYSAWSSKKSVTTKK